MLNAFLIFIGILYCATAFSQHKRVVLPDFTYRERSADGYRWKKVGEEKERTLLYNTLFSDDSSLYSFGGFNLKSAERGLSRIQNGRLQLDRTFRYPGRGAIYNIAFLRDSFLYIGGGYDSNASRYGERDFYRYNRFTGNWQRLKDLPFYYRHWVAVFKHRGNFIFLIPQLRKGLVEAVPVFYRYDDAADHWTILSEALPGDELYMPVTFQIGAEVFTLFEQQGRFGTNQKGHFWKFHLDSLTWAPLPPPPGAPKSFAMTFSDGSYGFLVGGSTSGASYTKTGLRFDPYKNRWESIRNFPRFIRHGSAWRFREESYVGFGINDEPNTIGIWKLIHKRQR